MARTTYTFAKRQREMAKKQKKEAKRLLKQQRSADPDAPSTDTPSTDAPPPDPSPSMDAPEEGIIPDGSAVLSAAASVQTEAVAAARSP